MKTNRINYVFIFLMIFAGLMTSCVKDDDFSVPDTSINAPEIDGDTISIQGVKNLFMQDAGVSNLDAFGGSEQLTFQGTKLYMTGYVISSDEAGNFHQELILQDKAENPTSGIKIMLEANPLFTMFEVGRKVYVELDGFTVGFSNGLIALGIPTAGSNFVNRAPQSFKDKILRTPELATIVPKELGFADFKRQNDNLFIKLKNVEFPANIALGDNAKSFAAEPGEQFDAERTVEGCENGSTALITSTFADFKALKLPKGSGDLNVVLTKTFNGSAYRVKLNDTTGIDFGEERCNGEDNGEEPGNGDMTIVGLPFFEDFTGLADFETIALNGWTNQDLAGSSRYWEARSFSNNIYAQLTAFNAGGSVETWLVTPGLDLTSASNPELEFDTKDGYYNGKALTVYVSTDFNGNAANATWDELNNVTLSQGHTGGYGDDFISSGVIDLSQYAGQVIFVGFEYKGNDGGVTTTMQIDNISVKESGDDNGGDDGDDDDDDDTTPPSDDATLAFAGADFENWNDFLGGLSTHGLKTYATQGVGSGRDGSNSLNISTDPGTTDGNDYVFTALATDDLPSSYSKISFYMKGSSTKSVSFNLYKEDGSYYTFNLGDLTNDAVIAQSESNQYTGNINTNGNWVLVNLDLSNINDLNVSDTGANIIALKIGKNADYSLDFDNFTIE